MTTATETPVLDLLAQLNADAIEASNLDPEKLMLVRIAALVAMDAPPASYLVNLAAAAELQITEEQVREVLIAVAPIVGTPRVVSAAGKIARAVGIAIAVADADAQAEVESGPATRSSATDGKVEAADYPWQADRTTRFASSGSRSLRRTARKENTMSQSHLVIDFPIKAPANAKALTEELPPLMPDFAKVQDDLGTVHFSRFMVEGDEKLLFLSDIDGEVDQHIERLVERAGPVFDAIFKHVDDPPATPVADDPQRAVKWLKHHVREPALYVLRVRGRFGSGHQGGSACGGLHGQYVAGHLADLHVHQVTCARLCHEAGSRGRFATTPMKRRSLLERCISLIGCSFQKTTWASSRSTTVTSRSTSRTSQRRLRWPSMRLSTRRWRAADPGGKERPGVLSVGIGKQLSAHRVLQRLSGTRRFKTSEPCWPTTRYRRPLDSTAVMVVDTRAISRSAKVEEAGAGPEEPPSDREKGEHHEPESSRHRLPDQGSRQRQGADRRAAPADARLREGAGRARDRAFLPFHGRGRRRSFSSSRTSTARSTSTSSGSWSVPARCSTPSSSTWTTLQPRAWPTTRRRSSNG